MEIESKYAIIGALDPAMLESLDLGPYHLSPLGDETHDDVILDTPRRAVTGNRHGLRIRRYPAKTVLTLKSGGRFADGIHEREEVEATLPADADYDLRHWPAEIGERVQALIADESLAPIIEVKIRRRTWAVERDGQTIGELALDEGAITANGRSEAVHEIEVEIKDGGTRADLEQIGVRLQALLPLQPESRTKMKRGLALLAGPSE